MKNKLINFFRSSSIYIIGMFIVRASGLLTMPILTRFLTKEEYGILSVANSIGAFLLTLFGMGSAEFILRYYWENEGKERKNFFGSFFFILMFFSLIFFVIPLTVFGEFVFGVLFSSVEFYPYILLVIWSRWLSNLNILPYEFLKIRKQPRKYMSIVLSSTFLGIILTLVLVIIFSYGALGPILSKFVISLIFGIYFLYYTLKEITFSFSRENAKSFFSFNSPLLIALICGSLLSHVDIFILQKYVPLSEVALYSVGVSIAGLIPFFVKAVNLAWAPFFYENVFKSNKEDASKLFGFSIDYLLLGVLFIVTGIILLRQEVVLILASSKYIGVCNVMVILIVGYLFISMRGFASRGILLANKNVLITFTTIMGVTINLCLNIYFIPRYGIYGAAYTTAFSSIMMYIILHACSQRYYKIDFHYIRALKLAIISIAIALLGHMLELIGIDNFVSQSFFNSSMIISVVEKIIFKGLILVILFPLFLFLSNYFYDNEKAIIKKLFYQKILKKKVNA